MTNRQGQKTTLTSPAKVNLSLTVLGKRPDGFHDIHSIMQPLTLSDEIDLVLTGGDAVTVTCAHPGVPTDERNLAHRAATLFQRETGRRCGVAIAIHKRIPVAAGLGGGSSNAATVLMGLDRLLGTACGEERLREMGARLGSDVPFFILRSSAIARGRGEVLEKITLPPYWYILYNPPFAVSAAWAYENLNLTKSSSDIKIPNSEEVRGIGERMGDFLRNDLEKAVLEAHPELKEIKDLLHGAGAGGELMSGSGPTLFGLFFDEKSARSAFEKLKSARGDGAVLLVARGAG